jgi:hypothetical protein
LEYLIYRYQLAAASDGTKALFAGGLGVTRYNVVDIYDGSTWSTATLSVAR